MSDTNKASAWIWVSLGLIIGLFVAFILFLDKNIVQSGREETPVVKNTNPNSKPVFDFYTVLPERKIDVPDVLNNTPNIPNVSNKKKSSTAKYIVQAGSFQKKKDAERRKAELAFLGLQGTVNAANVKGITYYRVEMGPVSESQSTIIQKTMISNNLDFLAKSIP